MEQRQSWDARWVSRALQIEYYYAPSVDVIDIRLYARFPVQIFQIVAYPLDYVIFERPFDYLMQEVGGDELVYVRSRKIVREGLETGQCISKL